MSLHLCPCCNKLVPASHFRRTWSPEDLAELLNSAQFKGVLRHAINTELRAMAPTQQVSGPRDGMRMVPAGFWTHRQAVAELQAHHPMAKHYGVNHIAGLVARGKVEGANGLVLASSMQAYIQRYRGRIGAHYHAIKTKAKRKP